MTVYDEPLTADEEFFGALQVKIYALFLASSKRNGTRKDLVRTHRELHAIAAAMVRERPDVFGKPRLI